jgi:hypothetical protein
MVGGLREHEIIVLERLAVASERAQQDAAFEPNGDIVRPELDGAAMAFQHPIKVAHRLERTGAPTVGVDMVGRKRDRAIVARHRVPIVAEIGHQAGTIVVGIGIVGADRDRAVEAHCRARRPIERAQRRAAIVQRLG